MDKDRVNEEELSKEEIRERAMQAYLDEVAPISEFINQGFKSIDDRKKVESEDNGSES